MYNPFPFDDPKPINRPKLSEKTINSVVTGGTPNVAKKFMADIAEKVKSEGVIVGIDGYTTANWKQFVDLLARECIINNFEFEAVDSMEAILKPGKEIDEMIDSRLIWDTKIDPTLLYGKLYHGGYIGLFDEAKVADFQKAVPAKKTAGNPAVFLHSYDLNGSSLALAAKYVFDLVSNYVLYVLTCNGQILSRIEVVRMLEHYLTDACGQAQTKVRVDVDLAHCRSCSLTQLIFRNADSVLQSSAVLVDDLYILLRYRRCSVKNDRESRDLLLDLMQNIETKLRLCARFELERAMACTNRDSQRVYTGLGYELFYLFRLCIGRILCGYMYIILNTSQLSKLCLYYYAVSMRILNNLLCNLNILLERILGSIDHNGGKSTVYTGLADLEVCAVIQMQSDRNIRILDYSCLNQLLQISRVRILSCACGYLKDNRGMQLSCCLCDSLYNLHVVHIESADCIAAFICFFEHFCCCY